MPNLCCVCTKVTPGKPFILTEEEKAAIGPDAPEAVYYCKQCLKVMESIDSGAQLLKGLYEMELASFGVPNAQELSEKFHAQLLAKANSGKTH